jgi:hypothetical protein
MGSSSKVILVGATTLIVGAYGISLKKAESTGLQAAVSRVTRVQQERLEDAALRTALHEFVADAGLRDKSGTRKGLGGATFAYNVQSGAAPKLSVTITEVGGGEVTLSAHLRKLGPGEEVGRGPRKIHRGEWIVTKVFVKRQKAEKNNFK